MATAAGFFFAAAASELATKAWGWLGQTVVAPARYELDVRAATSDAASPSSSSPCTAWGPPGGAALVSPPDHILVASRRFLSARRVKMLMEGHVGALVAGSTTHDLRSVGSRVFMNLLLDGVQPRLRKLGLHVYNPLDAPAAAP